MSLNTKSTSGKGFSKSLFSIGGILLALLILVSANIIFSAVNARLDITEDGLYSLSDGTKKIIGNLEVPVIIKVFYSESVENMPVPVKLYAQRAIDFVKEYELKSNGAITVERFDPKPDSEEEEWAQSYGINAFPLPTGEKVYLGLVVTAADQEETIPFLDPSREEELEYEITRAVSRVKSPKKMTIGIASGLPVMGQPQNQMQQAQPPWLFVEELKKTYNIKSVSILSDKIDKDIDLLLVIYPKRAMDEFQYAVDQYLLSGGKAIFFLDPFSTLDAPQGMQGPAQGAGLEKLMKAWGVEFNPGKAVADVDYLTRLQKSNNDIEDNPLWLSIPSGAFDKKNVITSKLESMLLPVAGALKKTADCPYKYEALISSSENSNIYDAFKFRFGIDILRKEFQSSPDIYDLAVFLSGKFKTAFPDGKPEKKEEGKAEDNKDNKKEEQIKEAKDETSVLIVSDSDLLFDNYYVSRQNFMGFNISSVFNDNLNFLLNASELLTGSQDLIGVRTRAKIERPFNVVKELEKHAQAKWLSREQELEKRADDTNRMLRELEQKKDKSQKLLLSEEQEEEIKKFQQEKIKINKELKLVRRQLRADIENLGAVLKFINILLMPILITIAGIIFGVYRSRKSRS